MRTRLDRLYIVALRRYVYRGIPLPTHIRFELATYGIYLGDDA